MDDLQILKRLDEYTVAKTKLRIIEDVLKSEINFAGDEAHEYDLEYDIDIEDKRKDRRKRKRATEFTTFQKKKIASDQRWKCKSCKKTLDEKYQVDHIVAVCDGGTSEYDNGQALCPSCHALKTKRDDAKRQQSKQQSAKTNQNRKEKGKEGSQVIEKKEPGKKKKKKKKKKKTKKKCPPEKTIRGGTMTLSGNSSSERKKKKKRSRSKTRTSSSSPSA